MKTNLNLLLALVLLITNGCSKDEAAQPTRTAAPTAYTFEQDSRLMGSWRADSSYSDTMFMVNNGIPEIGDSLVLSAASFSGSTPVYDFRGWYVSPSFSLALGGRFWQTKSDSLYILTGNHSEAANVSYRFKYNLTSGVLKIDGLITGINGTVRRVGYYSR